MLVWKKPWKDFDDGVQPEHNGQLGVRSVEADPLNCKKCKILAIICSHIRKLREAQDLYGQDRILPDIGGLNHDNDVT